MVGPANAPPGPVIERDRRPIVVVIVVLVIGIGAAFGAVVLLRGSGDSSTAAPGSSVSDGGEGSVDWDERVVHLISVVEDLRSLEFDHAVPVRFLPAAEFESEILDAQELTDEDRADIERSEAQLRAVGLLDADVDLLESIEGALSVGVVGLYDPEAEEILVKGDDLDPFTETTLVHELVHVLQDQHFDLERLGEADLDAEDTMLQALTEGDATRIEEMWKADQDADYLADYDDARAELLTDARFDDIPAVLEAFLGAPYSLGAGLASILAAELDGDAFDDLFTDTPTADLGLLDPLWLLDRLDGGDLRDDPPIPPLAEGEEPVTYDGEPDEGDFGAFVWYLLLATANEPLDALDAVGGWAGDSYVGYRRGEVECLRATFRGADAASTAGFEVAAQAWAAVAGATVGVEVLDVTVDACDDGEQVVVEGITDAVTVATVRTLLISGVVSVGGSATDGDCFADILVRRLTPAQLADESGEVLESPVFLEAQQEALTTCLS